MKILHINTNDLRGGAAKVMNRLIVAQNENGHQARALVYEKESFSPYSFPFDRMINHTIQEEAVRKGLLDYEYLGAFELINNPLFQEADIIHLHNIHGGFFNPYALSVLSHHKPIVWTLHDMQSVTGHCAYAFNCTKWEAGCGECPDLNEYPPIKVDRTGENWQEKKYIYENSKLFIVPVAYWIEHITSKSALSSQPMNTIHNGVNLDVFTAKDKFKMREKYGIPQHVVVIGAVANGGTFTQERKGGKFVQAVVERLVKEGHNVLLVNVGGEQKGYTQDYVYHVGYLSTDEEMAEVYSTFDIYLFPSMADTCPLVISEAMACEVPVVTFDTGGIAELVQHNSTGYVAPRGDLASLYEFTRKLVESEQLRKTLAKQALEYCQLHFDHRLVVTKYDEVYQTTINQHVSKKDQLFMLARKHVPASLWHTTPFQNAERSKRKAAVTSNQLRSNIYIVSNQKSVTYHENIVTRTLTFNDAYNYNFEPNDIILVDRDDYDIMDGFISDMLYQTMNTDVLTTTVNLIGKDGSKFYANMSNIIKQHKLEVMTSRGGIFYSGQFFNSNRTAILNGEVIIVNDYEEYNTPYVTTKVEHLIPPQTDKLYVYGAGTHTKELFNESPQLLQRVIGIIDSNTHLHGTLFLERFPIMSLLDVQPNVAILISSVSYEREIFKRIKTTIDNPIMTIYNN